MTKFASETDNPFIVLGYEGPDYFCDREDEINRLYLNMNNGINTTLISIRRMGKTGLVHHFFHRLSGEGKVDTLFVDLFETKNLEGFTGKFASAIFEKFPERKTFGEKLWDFIKGFQPVITYNALTGQPEIKFNFTDISDCERSLKNLFLFLEKQDTPILIAFDEFQQISEYPETNTEAILRTIIQTLKNQRFIFSGSRKHIIAEMFLNANRPFFSSTQMMDLEAINRKEYNDFIRTHFFKHDKEISAETVDFILDWTYTHTFYTQFLCNQVFLLPEKNITLSHVKWVCNRILRDNDATFAQYRTLLSPIQWSLLTAIAREDGTGSLSGASFLNKYHLSASGARRALTALLEKEMIFPQATRESVIYHVYNRFLTRWLQE
jgi:AAA+ ATPase superfamily predicted ATPase